MTPPAAAPDQPAPTDPHGPLVFLIAGEPSGDQLGAALIAGLRAETRGRVRVAGLGGPAMAAQGVVSLFPQSDLAIMGFVEVLPRIARILGRLRETLAEIRRLRPAAVVTIDSWGFTGRVLARMQRAGLPAVRVHYVAPMVWVWKPSRARQVAARAHHLLCLWPFEPPLFARHGLGATHVGHSVIESGADRGDGPGFRARHGLPAEAPVLVVLPGSRRGELARLMPVLAEAVARLAAQHPDLRVVVPTLEHLVDPVTAAVASWPVPTLVVTGARDKHDAFAAGRVAMAASGTVTLELALAGLPHVIAYRVHPVSAALFRRLKNPDLRFVNMINILLDRPAIPELLQGDCTGPRLAAETAALMAEGTARATQRAALAAAVVRLAGGDSETAALSCDSPAAPSRRAARLVLDLIAAAHPVGAPPGP